MRHGILVFALAFALCPWGAATQEPKEDPQVAGLIKLLASSDAAVRATAGRELLASGRGGIRALLDAAAGRQVFVAEQARELLTAAGPEAIDSINKVGSFNTFDHPGRLDEATAAVARMGEPVLSRMLRMFTTTDPAGNDFVFAVGVLLKMDGLALEPMIPLLKHPTRQVRHEAAMLLAHWGDPRAYDALVEGLASDDPDVRTPCARGLGNLGDHRAVEPLLRLLRDPAFTTRRAAAAALGKLYEPRFLGPLARLARADSEIEVRDTASNVLMYYSQDPVGVRIGKRYKPLALSPARELGIQFRFGLRFALTGALLLVLAVLLARRVARCGERIPWVYVASAACVAAGAGFLWGRVVQHIWYVVEYLLLFAFIPMVAWAAYVLGPIFARATKPLPLRSWLTTVGGFYAGYGIGWLALWGYLGF